MFFFTFIMISSISWNSQDFILINQSINQKIQSDIEKFSIFINSYQFSLFPFTSSISDLRSPISRFHVSCFQFRGSDGNLFTDFNVIALWIFLLLEIWYLSDWNMIILCFVPRSFLFSFEMIQWENEWINE
jgi:hypothetical protein